MNELFLPAFDPSFPERPLLRKHPEMIVSDSTLNLPPYDFSNPVDIAQIAAIDPLFGEIVDTLAFRRLKAIRFLGGIDYLFVRSPNGMPGNIRYTRYQHSLGVARLAILYSRQRSLQFAEHR